MERVRPRVAPKTWDAFRLTALEGCSGATAAARLGMKITRVYGAKSEVTRRNPGRGPQAGRERLAAREDSVRFALAGVFNRRVLEEVP